MSVASLPVGSARLPSVRSSTTTALVLVLLVATGWTVVSGGWSEATPSAVVVGVAGVVQAAILARGRVPRWVAAGSAPLLLFATLLPSTFGSRPTAPVGGIPHLVAQYADAAASGMLGNSAWEFNVSLSALLWLCGAWMAWTALRERRGALATAPAWAVLAVTVINAPTSDNLGLPATVTAVAAILVIAAVHLNRLNEGWQRRHVSVLPGTDGRFAGAAAVGGVLIVLLAAVAPPLTSTDISGRLFGFGGSHTGGGSGPGDGTGPGTGGTVRFNTATIPGGSLVLASAPVLSYTSSTGGGMYLRMATDGVFDGGNWLPDQSALNNGDFAAVVVPSGPIPRDQSAADGGIGGQRQTVSVDLNITNDTSGVNLLPFPGEPASVALRATANGLTAPGVNGQLLTIDTVTSARQLAGVTTVTTASVSTATTQQLESAGTTYPSFIARDGFLQLSDDGSGGVAKIRALALQWTAQSASPYDAAAAIEAHLRDPKLFRYTLTPPQPPAGSATWAVTYFLDTSHAGYCQYFATAMGAMLRAIGVPSRLVNGYGPGTSPGAAERGVNANPTFSVTSNDAHTWVEAYFPGYGWVPFEPTPSSQAGDYSPFPRGAAAVTTGPAATPAALPSPTAAALATPNTTSTGGGIGGGAVVALTRGSAAVGGILVVALLFAAWFLRPRTVRSIWRRVHLLGALAGVRRDPSLTFDEYAGRLGAALPARSEAQAAALADIATISGRALYARQGSDQGDTGRAAAAWRRAAPVLVRVGWRAIRRRRLSP
jgi:hypothetical protein